MAEAAQLQSLIEDFSDWRWRLNNLYWIRNEKGEEVKFEPNWAQQELLDELHYANVILKARQIGFTTLIQLLMLDACVFNDNIAAATIAHRLEDAQEIFENKIRFAYSKLPAGILAQRTAVQDSVRKLSFNNDSHIRVSTELRSGTYQYLHISEHGKLCAKYPDKAAELRSGALNTIHAGQMIFIESTAEGREGDFFEFCQRSRALQAQKRALTRLDFKFFFFPWHQHPSYRLTPVETMETPIPADMRAYFEKLADQGIHLQPEQAAWYTLKEAVQQDDMQKEFPSTPDEAFAAAVEGAYYAKEIAQIRARGQITRVPYEPSLPVNTYWDLGMRDQTTIWFHQHFQKEHRFLGYYSNSGEGLAHYVKFLDKQPFVYGVHYLPHDIEVTSLSTGKTRKETLEDLGVRNIKTVVRTPDVSDDIQAARNMIPKCWFDEEMTSEGLKCLENYRKEWDEKLGAFKNKPLHNWASHGADAFRCFAAGYMPEEDDEDDFDYEFEHGRDAVTGY